MSLAYSMPKSAKLSDNLQTIPGPNAYNTKNYTIIKKELNPEYHFSKDCRFKQYPLSPGPGDYNSQDKMTKQKRPLYSMFKKRVEPRSKYNVGPGDYSPHYDIQTTQNPSYTFLGYGYQFKNTNPGPFEYDIKTTFRQPQMAKTRTKFIVRLKQKSTQNDSQQQNGSLQTQRELNKTSIWDQFKQTFYETNIPKNQSKEPRFFGSKKKHSQNGTNSSKVSFSPQKTLNSMNYCPGPASYDTLAPNSKISIKMGSKKQYSFDNKMPGPGSYSYLPFIGSEYKGKNRFSIGREKRMPDDEKGIPGPGSYDNLSEQMRKQKGKIAFGRQEKMKMELNNNPSVGQYKLKSMFRDKNDFY